MERSHTLQPWQVQLEPQLQAEPEEQPQSPAMMMNLFGRGGVLKKVVKW